MISMRFQAGFWIAFGIIMALLTDANNIVLFAIGASIAYDIGADIKEAIEKSIGENK